MLPVAWSRRLACLTLTGAAAYFAATGVPSVALGDEVGTSKENPNIEAQGRIHFGDWLLKHGQLGTSIQVPFTSKGATGPMALQLDLSVTAVDPTFDASDASADQSFLAVEAKVQVVHGKSVVFAPQEVRVDAFKSLFPTLGVTLQGLGYEYSHIAGQSEHGIQFADLTINEALVLKEDQNGSDSLALTLKGRVSVGFTPLHIQQNESAGIRALEYSDKYSGTSNTRNSFSGSIGLRIMNSVLVEIFGDLNQFSGQGVNFRETSVGAKVRGLILGGRFQPYAQVEKRTALARVRSYREESESVFMTLGITYNW